MTYLKQFKEKIRINDYTGFLKIWEEYCYNEDVNFKELKKILIKTQKSKLADSFGQHVNRAMYLWEKLDNPKEKHEIIKLISDIQNKNDETYTNIGTCKGTQEDFNN